MPCCELQETTLKPGKVKRTESRVVAIGRPGRKPSKIAKPLVGSQSRVAVVVVREFTWCLNTNFCGQTRVNRTLFASQAWFAVEEKPVGDRDALDFDRLTLRQPPNSL